jgi:hypothetical protein
MASQFGEKQAKQHQYKAILARPRQPNNAFSISFLVDVLDLAENPGDQKPLTFVIFRKLLKALI